MTDDFRLQEECQALQDTDSYTITNEHNVRDMDAREVSALLEGESRQRSRSRGHLVNPFQALSSPLRRTRRAS